MEERVSHRGHCVDLPLERRESNRLAGRRSGDLICSRFHPPRHRADERPNPESQLLPVHLDIIRVVENPYLTSTWTCGPAACCENHQADATTSRRDFRERQSRMACTSCMMYAGGFDKFSDRAQGSGRSETARLLPARLRPPEQHFDRLAGTRPASGREHNTNNVAGGRSSSDHAPTVGRDLEESVRSAAFLRRSLSNRASWLHDIPEFSAGVGEVRGRLERKQRRCYEFPRNSIVPPGSARHAVCSVA